jgi:hypothetical protein
MVVLWVSMMLFDHYINHYLFDKNIYPYDHQNFHLNKHHHVQYMNYMLNQLMH